MERRLYYEARNKFQEDLEADLNAELLFRKDQAQISKARGLSIRYTHPHTRARVHTHTHTHTTPHTGP